MKKAFQTQYNELADTISAYIQNGKITLIEKAFRFGLEAHKDQYRMSGEPYFNHCIAAANILAGFKMDVITVAAGLLHDIVEDTGVSLSEINNEFGDDIAHLVDGVTKIADLKFGKSEIKQAENFRKIVLAMAKDIRVIMIKFADRLHNMQTLQFLPVRKQKMIAQETLDVYAPLAHRFGIARLGWELEDLAFKYLYPRKYSYLNKKIVEKCHDTMEQIEKMKAPIHEKLNSLKIPREIVGRQKSHYSIYRKMIDQNIPIEEIYDLLALRIITKKQKDCYLIMYAIHSLFSPASDRIKDYIATPKSNGYRSLHTTVKNPGGDWVEVQIRTKDMDFTAEMGIAAHWQYKSKQIGHQVNEQLLWVRQFLDWNKGNSDPSEFMRSFKFDLYKDEIFTFSPKGRLINLPVNATPVDFAFAVHTEVGLHCIGAKVNSRVVPLYSILEDGDEVEIITTTNPNLKENWVTFVVTSRARTYIKKWLRENKILQYRNLGKELLQNELAGSGSTLDKLDNTSLIQQSGYSSLQSLLQAIGAQAISLEEVVKRLELQTCNQRNGAEQARRASGHSTSETVITIGRDYPLVIELSACCTPIPYEKIIGIHKRDTGVTIHRMKCPDIPKSLSRSEQWVQVTWGSNKDRFYRASMKINAADRKHMLRDIVLVISKLDINITKIHVEVEDISAVCDLSIEVRDKDQLKNVITAISKVKGIQHINR